MLTRIDHVIICVPDLSQSREQYRKLEFDIHARLTTRNTPRTLYAEALASRKAIAADGSQRQ